MATQLIPVRSDMDDWSQVVDLDGATYQLRWRWNVRDEAWVLDVRDGEGANLLTGVAVRVDVPLTGLSQRGDLPPGQLFAFDTSGEHKDVDDKEDLGDRVKVIYVPEDDL